MLAGRQAVSLLSVDRVACQKARHVTIQHPSACYCEQPASSPSEMPECRLALLKLHPLNTNPGAPNSTESVQQPTGSLQAAGPGHSPVWRAINITPAAGEEFNHPAALSPLPSPTSGLGGRAGDSHRPQCPLQWLAEAWRPSHTSCKRRGTMHLPRASPSTSKDQASDGGSEPLLGSAPPSQQNFSLNKAGVAKDRAIWFQQLCWNDVG